MRLHVTILAAIALLPACVPLDENNSGTNTTVSVVDYFFSPGTDTIVAGVGDTSNVTFTWIPTPPGNTNNGHVIVWDSAGTAGTRDPAIGLPPGSDLMLEGSFKVTLVPATYWYHCSRHAPLDPDNYNIRTGMIGSITVKPHSAAQSRLLGI